LAYEHYLLRGYLCSLLLCSCLLHCDRLVDFNL
jgi:hypothetical protein